MEYSSIFYFSSDSPFSNFYPCYLNFYGIKCRSSEQFYLLSKAEFYNQVTEKEKVLAASRPEELMALKQAIDSGEKREGWEMVKEVCMTSALSRKVSILEINFWGRILCNWEKRKKNMSTTRSSGTVCLYIFFVVFFLVSPKSKVERRVISYRLYIAGRDYHW